MFHSNVSQLYTNRFSLMCVNLNQMLHFNVIQPKTNIYSLMCCPLYSVWDSWVAPKFLGQKLVGPRSSGPWICNETYGLPIIFPKAAIRIQWFIILYLDFISIKIFLLKVTIFVTIFVYPLERHRVSLNH